ncbi:MAG TPA: peptidase M14, partial [Alicycliphilus sp.]|nr:peptidase M14 [Alicycliphilus sp.]
MTHTTAGTTLLDLSLERTLDQWVQRFSQPEWRGRYVEGWLFEGQAARRGAEQQLAALGVQARFHSAYKPLVQHFIDDVERAQLLAAHVRYPTAQVGPAQRFRLEAYPLAALLPEGALTLEPRADALPHYDVELQLRSGKRLTQRVRAPNRRHADASGAPALSPTGWLRVGSMAGAADLLDCAENTDYEQAFAQALHAVRAHAWPEREPYFERLQLRIDLPGYEQPIAGTDEVISTTEALHEDLYFSLLEFFQQHSGRPVGDRRLQPGQIVPDVRTGASGVRVLLSLQAFDAAAQDALAAPQAPPESLAELDGAPAPDYIAH